MIFYVHDERALLSGYPLCDRSNVWIIKGVDLEYHTGVTLCPSCGWSFIIVKPANKALVCPMCATDEQRDDFAIEVVGVGA